MGQSQRSETGERVAKCRCNGVNEDLVYLLSWANFMRVPHGVPKIDASSQRAGRE